MCNMSMARQHGQVEVPWVTSRSAEWGENAFYKERAAKHVAAGDVLGELTKHRWGLSAIWAKWGGAHQRHKPSAALQNASMPMPFPCWPESVRQFDEQREGRMWKTLQHVVKPLLDRHSLEWGLHKNEHTGHNVWVVRPTDQANAHARTCQTVAENCSSAVGAAAYLIDVTIGPPHKRRERTEPMPQGGVTGAKQTGTRGLCAMLACVATTTGDKRDLAHVYPEDALERQQREVQPTLLEDAVLKKVCMPYCDQPLCCPVAPTLCMCRCKSFSQTQVSTKTKR